jgi:hypothetical protein
VRGLSKKKKSLSAKTKSSKPTRRNRHQNEEITGNNVKVGCTRLKKPKSWKSAQRLNDVVCSRWRPPRWSRAWQRVASAPQTHLAQLPSTNRRGNGRLPRNGPEIAHLSSEISAEPDLCRLLTEAAPTVVQSMAQDCISTADTSGAVAEHDSAWKRTFAPKRTGNRTPEL